MALALAALLAVVAPTKALDSDLYLAGLGLHQETGRNIYLGGIYLEREAPRPADFTQATGTRVMEYRVVARRTSMRSLLGGMLLQSEVATGKPADQDTAQFVDDILTVVNTSLYAGDSLEIKLSDNNQTVALLNGHELARASKRSVADYLLMGWVGDSGPSTSFREDITRGDVDPSLLVELESHTFTAQREAEIASWLGDEEEVVEEPAESPVGETVAAAQETAASNTTTTISTGVAATTNAAVVTSTTASATASTNTTANITTSTTTAVANSTSDALHVATGSNTAPSAATPAIADATAGSVAVAAAAVNANADATTDLTDAPATTVTDITASADTDAGLVALDADGPVQVAALVPTQDVMPSNPLEREVAELGIQEYSQRLAAFHTQLVRMVYGEIKYPKRAVRRSLEGRMELDVTMTSQGRVISIEIASSSGHPMLDDAAIAAAQEAFGSGLRGAVDPVAIAEFGSFATEQLTIPVPVAFRLQ